MERRPSDDQQPPGPTPEPGDSGAPGRGRSEPLIPDVLEPGEAEYERRDYGDPFGGRVDQNSPFGPRSFGGGRVQVYGCSPGCIIVSIVVSVVLSVLLTLLLNLIF
jgi:hypothetical protein